MESCLTHLEGSRTQARYTADAVQTVDPVDGAPLLARYDLKRAARTLTPRALAERSGPGMWRWAELLPVRDRAHRIHLGEGATPLLGARRLGAALGIDHLMVKAEGLNPTGSFKARGMSAAVSRARELGCRGLVVPSAGNAGGALAAYGAAAGLPVTVVLPADSPEVNVVEAQMMGATVLLVDGVISDCGVVSRAIAGLTGAMDVATLAEPYRVEGKKTMGLEIVEQLGWGVPDVIVYPTGGGTGLVGMWKAFEELEALGLIGAGRPRLVAAQAEGCAPIVRAFQAGAETAAPWEDPTTRASGLRVPSARGDRLMLTALRESDGTAVAVPEAEIDAIQKLAGRRGVGYVSPESAVAFAALAVLADEGWVSANERVVVFDCGIGQKYPPPELQRPPVLDPAIADDPEALGRVLSGRARRTWGGGGETLDSTTPQTPPGPPVGATAPAETAPPVTVETAPVQAAPVRTAPPPVRPPHPTPPPGSAMAALLARRRADGRGAAPTGPSAVPRVPGEAAGAATPVRPAPRVPGEAGAGPPPPVRTRRRPVHSPPRPTVGPTPTPAPAPDGAAPVSPLPAPPFREIVVPPLPEPPTR